jgi:hypothetical protein
LKKTLLALKGTIKPIYNTEVSKKIPAKILALVGVKILLQSSLNFLQERLLSSTLLIISSRRGLNSLPLPYLLFMFPIEGENNKRWENISTIIFLTEEFDYA